MSPIAIAMRHLYLANIEAGFSESQALDLIKDFQKSIIQPMIAPLLGQEQKINEAISKFLEEDK